MLCIEYDVGHPAALFRRLIVTLPPSPKRPGRDTLCRRSQGGAPQSKTLQNDHGQNSFCRGLRSHIADGSRPPWAVPRSFGRPAGLGRARIWAQTLPRLAPVPVYLSGMKQCLVAVLLGLIAAPTPAAAWQAGTEGPLCILSHDQGAISVRLTYDPRVPLYTIAITAAETWPVADGFGIQFVGEQPNTIQTNRHVLSPDLRTLSVSDRGFGNVLDGLQFNETAIAMSGLTAATVSLEGAAPAVETFRTCGQVPSV